MRTAALALLLAACSSSSAPPQYNVPPGCESCVSPSTGLKSGYACCSNDPSGDSNFCAVGDCLNGPADGGSDARRD